MASDTGTAAAAAAGATVAEVAAMRIAIDLARSTPVPTRQNPRVGCVLLDTQQRVAATGLHRGPGSPHAEVDALSKLGAGVMPRTAVVTLEPCHHTGHTGPCTRTLRARGVSRVVYGTADPNPLATGGAAWLRSKGIQTIGDVLGHEAEAVDSGWFAAIRLNRPQVTWKLACTLDGRVAAVDGTSRWISSPQSRAEAHRLRAESDAVIAGAGTIAVDDPQLSARAGGQPLPRLSQPLRVVLGRRQLPTAAACFDDTAPTVQLPSHDPAEVLGTLWQRGCRRVLLEGGPTLAAAFWRAGLVDRVVMYLAPALLGAGPGAVGDLGIDTISQILRLRLSQVNQVGPDIRLDLTNPTTIATTHEGAA